MDPNHQIVEHLASYEAGWVEVKVGTVTEGISERVGPWLG